jgi:cation diffusion facilitator CzcD-associated flavoprotein CzcO
VSGGSQEISEVALSASRDNPHDRELDVVVVGGGQAGLAMGWHLAERGLSFLVLEAGAEVGDPVGIR